MVTHILAAHYVRQLYEVGQYVRVDEVEGRIVRITQTAVILHSDEGQVVVPASTFATTRSTRLVQEA
jgi:small-conductance mechanosensitive channel